MWRQKDPKPLTPSLATIDCADVNHEALAELAAFKQGPPDFLIVGRAGQADGIVLGEVK